MIAKRTRVVFFFFLCSLCIRGEAEKEQCDLYYIDDAVAVLEQMTEVLSEQIEQQKGLKQQIRQYQLAFQAYQKEPDNQQVVNELVQTAGECWSAIESLHLTHLFSEDFLEEISALGKLSQKQILSRP